MAPKRVGAAIAGVPKRWRGAVAPPSEGFLSEVSDELAAMQDHNSPSRFGAALDDLDAPLWSDAHTASSEAANASSEQVARSDAEPSQLGESSGWSGGCVLADAVPGDANGAAQGAPGTTLHDTAADSAAEAHVEALAASASVPAAATEAMGATKEAARAIVPVATPSRTRQSTTEISVCKFLSVEAAREKPMCHKCGMECDPFSSYLKSKTSSAVAAKWICRPCNRITSILIHNMKWPCEEFQSLTDSEQQAFFANAASTRSRDSDRFSYSKLKTVLVNTLTTRHEERVSASLDGSFLPLSWYEQKGCTQEQLQNIELNAPKQMHPVLGATYRVNIKSISRSTIMSRVQESIAQSEQSMKAKKLSKKEPAGSIDDCTLAIMDAVECEEDAAQAAAAVATALPPSTPAPAPADPKAAAAAAKAAEKKQKMEEAAALKAEKVKAAKDEKDRKSHNLKTMVLCTRTISAGEPLADLMKDLLKSEKLSQLPTWMVDELSARQATLAAWLAECKALKKDEVAASKKQLLLPAPTFSDADVKHDLKATKEECDKFKKMLALL